MHMYLYGSGNDGPPFSWKNRSRRFTEPGRQSLHYLQDMTKTSDKNAKIALFRRIVRLRLQINVLKNTYTCFRIIVSKVIYTPTAGRECAMRSPSVSDPPLMLLRLHGSAVFVVSPSSVFRFITVTCIIALTSTYGDLNVESITVQPASGTINA